MEDTTEKNGNAHIPVSVLNKFIELSDKNNAAYMEIVGSLESMSDKLLQSTEELRTLETKIDKENLAQAVHACTVSINSDVDDIKKILVMLSGLDLSPVTNIANHLKVKDINQADFSSKVIDFIMYPFITNDNSDDIKWVLRRVHGLRMHWGKILMVFGATLAFIYFNVGKDILMFIKTL